MKKTLSTMLSVLTLVGGAVVSSNSHAESHLGQPLQNHIVLRSYDYGGPGHCETNGSDSYDFFQVRPNGDVAAAPFKVPAKKEFVITGINWLVNGKSLIYPGVAVYASLNAIDRVGSYTGILYKTAPVNIEVAGGAMIGSRDSLHAGVRVAPGRGLCLLGMRRSSGGLVGLPMVDATITGYLISR